VVTAWTSDFHSKNANTLLHGRCKTKGILYKEGNPASSFCGYKHSVVEWFTTKSKVILEHTLKELSKVTERGNMPLQRKTIFHILSAGHS